MQDLYDLRMEVIKYRGKTERSEEKNENNYIKNNFDSSIISNIGNILEDIKKRIS